MVLSTDTFNQSVRTEYSEAVNARYTFQPLWVSAYSVYGCYGKVKENVTSLITNSAVELLLYRTKTTKMVILPAASYF